MCSRKKKRASASNFSSIAIPSMKGYGYLDYTVENHTVRAFETMDEFRKNKQLCDIKICVKYKDQEEEFFVHKIVLASCSSYFKAMFTNEFKECHAPEITIQDVCPRVIQTIVDFAYTSRITVGQKCVLHVLLAAMIYQVEDVAKVCCDFLLKHLDPSNVIGISSFAEQIGCCELSKKAKEYINMHFNEVAKEEEFLSLSHCALVDLISQENLLVLCESEVYKACIEWVRWDIDNRAQYFHALLNAVHLYSLPPKFLMIQLQHCPILHKADTCRDYLSRVFQEMALHKPLPPTKLRGNQLIYVAGGYLQHSLTSMVAYNPRTEEWVTLMDMPTPRSGLGACVVCGLFYAVGGRNNSLNENTDSRSLHCFNPMTNQWSTRADMTVPRNRVGVAVIDGFIYAVGGSSGSAHHNSVEKYDPEKDEWTVIASMSTNRIGAGVAACNGLLYAIGGFDGENRCSSVECYHPDRDVWVPVASMQNIRSGAGVVTLNKYIYVIGGYDGANQLDSVERYDTENDHWDTVSFMTQKRSALGAAVHQGKIYTFGGFNQSGFLSTVECYNPETNEWRSVTDMPSSRSGMGVAVTMEPCIRTIEENDICS